ncbi:21S rRNA (GM2251-2'-O)-methyltransferase [Apostasia shenzhenica]|uniref:rRNA methyltransferase 1, mitochondrial n=1 Tax=Apostasia shenzhenica TaxID=1088818 RepID=A0A2I0ANU0_9ASPA|nr:21S rRNA (GM2251-2'-O)-methyltransferase [Apostasia shenzhenica]
MYCHSCCIFARSSPAPLISRVSVGFSAESMSSSSGYRLGLRKFSTLFLQQSLAYGDFFLESARWVPNACFSSESRPKSANRRSKVKSARPWMAVNGGREENMVVKQKNGVKPSLSSWELSAENYFSRNGGRKFIDKSEGKDGQDEDDEVAEPADNPRWDKIKNNYKGFIDRESRFEKPEVRQWSKQETWGRKTWREASESSMVKMVGQGIYGVGPVLAALMVGRREFYALYLQEGLELSGNGTKKKDKKGVDEILKLADEIGLKVIEASKHDLNLAVDNRPHQGLVLDASPLEMVDIRELEPVSMAAERAPLWVALDEVTDPQNLGAIIRSSYFFGAEGVVLCSKNSAPLSGVVSKASAGSLELIELRSCKNMMKFLSSSADNGWRVLGGSISSKALPLGEVEAGKPTVLVLGSEGSGLRPLVERSCTQLIRIPGCIPADDISGFKETEVEEMHRGGFGQELKSFIAVESLNVSVAAGVLLYHLVGSGSDAQRRR